MLKRTISIVLVLMLVMLQGCFESKEKRYNRLYDEKQYMELYGEVYQDKEWLKWFDKKMSDDKKYKDYYEILVANNNIVGRHNLIRQIVYNNMYEELMYYLDWGRDGDYFVDELVQNKKFIDVPQNILSKTNNEKLQNYCFITQYVFIALNHYVQDFRFNERAKAIDNISDIFMAYNYSKFKDDFLDDIRQKQYSRQIIIEAIDFLYTSGVDMQIILKDKMVYSITCKKGYGAGYKDGIVAKEYFKNYDNSTTINRGNAYIGYTYYIKLSEITGNTMLKNALAYYRSAFIG